MTLNPKAATPPIAQKVAHELTLHGETLRDDYFWMREKTNPAVVAHLNAENTYTDAVMKPTESRQEDLYQEMLGRIKQTDLSVPYVKRGYEYWTQTEEGKQYPIYMRRKLGGGADEVLLDVNWLAEGEKFMSVGDLEVSDDGRLLAYTTDNTGFRQYRLHIRSLPSGENLPDTAERVTALAWDATNSFLFYGTEDEVSKRSDRVFRLRLGHAPVQVFEEKDPLYRCGPHRSLDGAMIFISSGSFDNGESRFIPAASPESDPSLIAERHGKVKYEVAHREGQFYIRTNKEAHEFSIMTAPVANPGRENWQPFFGPVENGSITGFQVFKDHMVLSERKNGLPALEVFDFRTGKTRDIPTQEELCSISPHVNAEYETKSFRYRYASPVTPESVFEVDLDTFETKLLKQTEVLGGFDPAHYDTLRVWATAPDGTAVPMGLLFRKGVVQDGTSPCLLTAYGSYGAPTGFGFNGNVLSLVDRGFVFAVAQIRGGGDFGERWHDEGKMMTKRNTFTDFVACADELVYSGWTSRDRLAISGGSAGGLLIGAVINIRPDLCRAAILNVPFVDVINTMYDESLPLTVGEFLEWGNPKVEKEYRYIRTYSPYENIRPTRYPAILVKTSFNDSQVMVWEPAKYTAKMREVAKPDLLVFRCNMSGGHGGSSGRYDQLRERAFEYGFVTGVMEVVE